MDTEKINVLKAFFNDVCFVKTEFDFSKNEACRVSSKTLVIDYALQNLPFEQGEKICIMDVDTIVTSDIAACYKEDFDIGITDDISRKTPLNSGVILLRFSEKIKTFSSTWVKKTFEIFKDSEKMKTSLQRPYSGTDQMSLWEIIGYSTSLPAVFRANIDSIPFTVKKFECKQINHIYDGEVSKDALILHYKGIWNDFLIKGIIPSPSNFQKYKIFAAFFQKALASLNKTLNTNYTQRFFNIQLHKLYALGRLSIWHPHYHISRNAYKLKNSLLSRLGLREK